jgi:hypothetical protein
VALDTAESYVQVATDGAGKSVRNLRMSTIVDGVETTVYMQVVSIADENGRVLSLADDLFTDLLAEQIKTNELLLRVAMALEG